MSSFPIILKPQEAADYLGIIKRHLNELRRKGYLGYYVFSKRAIRYGLHHLTKFQEDYGDILINKRHMDQTEVRKARARMAVAFIDIIKRNAAVITDDKILELFIGGDIETLEITRDLLKDSPRIAKIVEEAIDVNKDLLKKIT